MTSRSKVELTPAVSERDHVRGGSGAVVTLLEYGDFDCPYCAKAFPAVRAVERHFGARLRFVFRHNPRGELHAHARVAAQASEAASLQGRFWAMHDCLFEQRGPLDEGALWSHARALDLDLERFGADLHSKSVLARVREDEVSGLRSGVISTPSFFVDGRHFRESPDLEAFVAAIEARLSPPSRRRTRRPLVRVDGAGHMNPRHRAFLLAESGRSPEVGLEPAFLAGPRSSDPFAEALGEDFVEVATTGEDESEDVFNQTVPEDDGGPFVETTGSTEFAHGTDASNIPGATREPFPKT
jgi:hypothetical protein